MSFGCCVYTVKARPVRMWILSEDWVLPSSRQHDINDIGECVHDYVCIQRQVAPLVIRHLFQGLLQLIIMLIICSTSLMLLCCWSDIIIYQCCCCVVGANRCHDMLLPGSQWWVHWCGWRSQTLWNCSHYGWKGWAFDDFLAFRQVGPTLHQNMIWYSI